MPLAATPNDEEIRTEKKATGSSLDAGNLVSDDKDMQGSNRRSKGKGAASDKHLVEVSPQILRTVKLDVPVYLSEQILRDIKDIPPAVADSETVKTRLLAILAEIADVVDDNKEFDSVGNYRWKSDHFPASAILGVGSQGRKYAPYKMIVSPQRPQDKEAILEITKDNPEEGLPPVPGNEEARPIP